MLESLLESSRTQFRELVLNEDDNVITVTFCQWLDVFMYYQAMWVPITNKNVNRNKFINTLGIIISILFIISWSIMSYFDCKFDNSLQVIILIVAFTCATISRLISIYFLYFKFSFHGLWYNLKLKYDGIHSPHNNVQKYLNKNIKYLNYRLKFYVIFCYLSFTIHQLSYTYTAEQTAKNYTIHLYNYFDALVSFFGFFIPLCLFQIIWSIISLKYQCKLYYLQQLFNNKEQPNFTLILKKYKRFYRQFQSEYKIWNYYMMFLLLWIFSNLWDYVNIVFYSTSNFHANFSKKYWLLLVYVSTGCIGYIAPLMEYSISSAKLNGEYDKLLDIIWKYDQDNDDEHKDNNDESHHLLNKFGSIDNKNDINFNSLDQTMDINRITLIVYNIKDYHFLLNYVPKDQLLVKIFGSTVSYYTPLTFIMAFGIAKFIIANITTSFDFIE